MAGAVRNGSDGLRAAAGSAARHGSIGGLAAYVLLEVLKHNGVVSVPPEALDGALELLALAAGGAQAAVGFLVALVRGRLGKAAPLTLLAAALLAGPVQAQTIFSTGFEESDPGAVWSYQKGRTSYPTTGCRSGARCGAKTLGAGSEQQSVFWAKEFNYSGPELYVSYWIRFPQGFTWDGARGSQSHFGKMLIVNTSDSVGRMHVVLTDKGTSPRFFITAERTDPKPPGIVRYTDEHWPTDGAWHHVEFEAARRPGDNGGRMRVWLDDRVVVDEKGRVCNPDGGPCSPVVNVELGAYYNQGSPKPQTFYMDDISVVAGTRADATGGAPDPSPGPKRPDIAAALDRAGELADQLEEARKLNAASTQKLEELIHALETKSQP